MTEVSAIERTGAEGISRAASPGAGWLVPHRSTGPASPLLSSYDVSARIIRNSFRGSFGPPGASQARRSIRGSPPNSHYARAGGTDERRPSPVAFRQGQACPPPDRPVRDVGLGSPVGGFSLRGVQSSGSLRARRRLLASTKQQQVRSLTPDSVTSFNGR